MTGVTVVDYGTGNLLSVRRAFQHAGADVELADDAVGVERAERLVLPGVGAFRTCIGTLRARGLIEAVRSFAATARPFLGICVGMQMMLDGSDEFGWTQGLGFISGRVEAIHPTGADGTPHKIPHIGWAELKASERGWKESILDGEVEGASVYFVHSFAVLPENQEHVLAVCDYNGIEIVAAVVRDNLFGSQFHPEKSGPVGLRIISNFLSL